MTMEKEFDTYLRIEDIAVDRSDVAMLRAIDDRGSLSGAADALERSYPASSSGWWRSRRRSAPGRAHSWRSQPTAVAVR